MRFHTKLGPVQAVLSLIPALLFGYSWMFGSAHRSAEGLIALFWLVSAAAWLSMRFFTYWDLDRDALRARGLWTTRVIPWSEVTYIGPWESAKSKWIVVEYQRRAPLSDRGRILATPARRADFVAALRQFAPQAQFEI
jgi:hypothetical protein